MNLRLRFVFWLVLATILCCFGQLAFADNITFTAGNQQLVNEENILFHSDMSGTLIMGFSNVTNTEVDFSSTTDILMGHGGQATVAAQDGLINDITISSPDINF